MENQHLRAIILKLQDRLTENDRRRLHFLLSNDVPRGIVDNPTLAGTLSLMQSLFDQDKINEQDFTFLINAFDEIGCIDAVKLLKEHKKRIQSNFLNESTQSLSSIMPSMIDELLSDQDEDKSPTLHPLIKKSNDENQPFSMLFRTRKSFLIMVFLFVIIIGILVSILIVRINKHRELAGHLKKKDYSIMEKQKQENQTIQQLNDLVSEKNKKVEQWHYQIKELEEDKNSSLMKVVGQVFGGTGVDSFNDSLLPDFTSSHYLMGITVFGERDGLESYQFLYSTFSDYHNVIESKIHGASDSPMIYKYEFKKNEKIRKVEGQIIQDTIAFPNGTNFTTTRITGIQFHSNRDHANRAYNGVSGKKFSEEGKGYTLGYVTGRKSTQFINQLQFIWYRTVA